MRRAIIGMRRLQLAPNLVAATFALLIACGPTGRKVPVETVPAGLEPLRAQFNSDSSKLRLLLLLDPT